MKLSVRSRFGMVCGGVTLVVGLLLVALLRWWLLPDRVEKIAATWDPYGMTGVLRHRKRMLLDAVLFWGSIGALLFSVGAAVLGRLAAGWALRPLQEVTETARRVAQSHDLTGRIAYEGPKEEVTELAGIFDGMIARLARAFDGQRRFVANASHELRTPLAINRTLVDVAARRPDSSEDVRRLGESLLVVNTRHERLIDGLLALAEGEQAVLDRRPLDLTDMVEHVLDQAAGEAKEKNVTVHRLLDTAPTGGDAILLERLAQNLVDNGLRHNQPGGELWVTTRQHGDHAELVVANTGLAVPAYELETIFEPFRRLHADRLRSDRGSGLGLSIVRAIVEAHGGEITARPREEGGLTITVELPRHTSADE